MAENTAEEQRKSRKTSSRRRRERMRGGAADAAIHEEPQAEEAEDASRGQKEAKGVATPGRRNQSNQTKSKAKRGNALTRPFMGIINYFAEVRDEMQKVTWPTWPEAWRLTRIVIVVTIIASLVLGALSLIAGQLVTLGLGQPIIMVLIFVGIVGAAIYFMRRGDTSGGY